ncbi:armadillo-type protein [Annulohypoxylon moriforme]|nr:armadillo-type protein [Annulohypoxylon moriforme]
MIPFDSLRAVLRPYPILLSIAIIPVLVWYRNRFSTSFLLEHQRSKQPPSSKATTSPTRERVELNPTIPSNSIDDTESDVDIIAIHGLDTRSPNTWIWKDNHGSGESGVNWLEDDNMLPSHVKGARIFTCDWPAGLFETKALVENPFEALARLLLEAIESRPSIMNERTKKHRPILFIASCLGGIILLKALSIAIKEDRPTKKATRGVLFLATPFRGTSFHDVAYWALPGLETQAWVQNQRVSKLIELVNEPTPFLGELVRDFTKLKVEQNLIVSVFYERGYTNLRRKIPFLPAIFGSRGVILVSQESASLDCTSDRIALDRPHVQMNKFSGPEDEGFGRVASKVSSIIQEIRENDPLQKGDVYIRNNHYTMEKLAIKRLGGELLSIEQCYINLAIVEKPSLDMQTTSKSSSLSLSNRLKVETPPIEFQAKLPTLFDQRKVRDRDSPKPKRILIRGRAGIGKTTLCKKIVHDFVYNNMWNNMFSRILWVPLRTLTHSASQDRNLGNMFYNQFFANNPEGRNIHPDWWYALDASRYSDTLFLFDGLDEVSEFLDPSHEAFEFLGELLNSPNVIITTRPHTVLPLNIKNTDLELETIGFDREQVDEYIYKVVQKRANVEKMLSFLRPRKLLQSLVRIPIQLDAFCFIWEEHTLNSVLETMTSIYKAIVRSLWKKDVDNLKKPIDGSATQFQEAEIEDMVEYEERVVEILAFCGMYNNMVEFQPRYRNRIIASRMIGKPALPLKVSPLDEMLGRTSFLRSSDVAMANSKQSYHFLHLTFQEFFAAKYFVRQWTAGESLRYLGVEDMQPGHVEPNEFLQQNKYIARFDIMWRFAAGLLEGGQIQRFFSIIDQEPHDFLGPGRCQTVMHCLSEVDTAVNAVDFPIRSKLEDNLSQISLLEYEMNHSPDLAEQIEFPDRALCTALGSAPRMRQTQILRNLVGFNSSRLLSAETVIFLVKLSKENKFDSDFAEDITQKLKTHSALASSEYFSHFMDLVVDQKIDVNVRNVAADILAFRSTFSTDSIQNLSTSVTKSTVNFDSRYTAARAIAARGDIPVITNEILVAIIADSNEDIRIRRTLASALRYQSDLPKKSMITLEELIIDAHANLEVRIAVIQSLRPASNFTPSTLATLVELIEDTNIDIGLRNAVAKALESHRALPKNILVHLSALITHVNVSPDIQLAVIRVLEKQRTLPEDVERKLVWLLGDTEKNMQLRDAASLVLQLQPGLTEATLGAMTALLQTSDAGAQVSAAKILFRQSHLPVATFENLTTLSQKEGLDLDHRKEIILSLVSQSALPETTLLVIVNMLDDADVGIQGNAVLVLASQRNLPMAVIAAIVTLFKNKRSTVRCLATYSLRTQRNLPVAVTKAVASLFKDLTDCVRESASYLLKCQYNLPTAVIEILVILMEDTNYGVQLDASNFLMWHSSNWPMTLVPIITRLLESTSYRVRWCTLSSLSHRSTLAESLLRNIAKLLDDPEGALRKDAAYILGERENLPEDLVALWQTRLEDEKLEFDIRMTAARILQRQSNLPETTIAGFATLAETGDTDAIWLAISSFGKQANFPRAAAESFTRLVQEADFDLRWEIIENIVKSKWDLLTSATSLGLLRDSEQSNRTPSLILPVPLDTEFLYGYLLYRSLRGYLCLCVQDSELHIITPSTGSREATLVLDRTLDEMSSARDKWWRNWAEKHPVPTGEGVFKMNNT